MALITRSLEGKYNSSIKLAYNPEDDTATVNLAWTTDQNYWTEVEDLNKVLQTGTLRIAGPFSHRGNVTLEQHEIEWLVSTMESIAEEV
jgi:hypothetical protein